MAMNVDKVAVLNISPGEIERFSKAEASAPEGWQARVGEDGTPFFARTLVDGVLLRPAAASSDSEQLVQQLQRLLGATFDLHVDLRGVLVVTSNPSAEQSYVDVAVAGSGEWIARAASPEQAASPGWSFADAARTFATPGMRPRADAVVSDASKKEDPLDQADGKFGAIFASQNDRGALRRTLSAALDHSIESSLLGSNMADVENPKESEANSSAADAIRRGVSSDPKTMNTLEAQLRAAIDGGLKDDSENDSAAEKPAEQAAEKPAEDS